jgi:hypothetical protein
MLASEVTFTVDLTRYAVPASEDCTVALAEPLSVAVVNVADGASVSIVIDNADDVVVFPSVFVSVTVRLHSPSSKTANVQVLDVIVQETLVGPDFAAVTTAEFET